MTWSDLATYLAEHGAVGSLVFLLTFTLRFVEIARQEPYPRAILRSLHFWLYSFTHALLAAAASAILLDTTDWSFVVVVVVSVLGGLAVLRSFVVRFGTEEFELAGLFEGWRDDVISQVQENRADRRIREQRDAARSLEKAYRERGAQLEGELRRLASSLGLDATEVLEEIDQAPAASRLYEMALWIAITDIEHARRLAGE